MLDNTQKQKAGGRPWEFSLYSTDPGLCEVKRMAEGKAEVTKVRITGVNFSEQFYGKAAGDTLSPYLDGQDALLIELSPDLKTLTILVYEGMAAQVQSLYQKWLAGQLPETPAAYVLPLETKKAG